MIAIGDGPLTLEQIAVVSERRGDPREWQTTLSAAARERMARSRAAVEAILQRGSAIYGVNTGFGRLCDYAVPPDQLQALQRNLVRSHACGVGEPLSAGETRAMLLLRANTLGLGFSGARPQVADLVLEMLARDVLPVIPRKGSVGASGDLAPLAHLALVLIGEGEATFDGIRMTGAAALASAGLTPVVLEAKEGLALLNGTQAINAVGGLAVARALRVQHAATVASAMSLEGLLGTPVAFDERIHASRPHPAQAREAALLRSLLRNSAIRESPFDGRPARAGRLQPALHSSSSRGRAARARSCAGSSRDRDRIGHRQPADFSGRRRC